jgi:hypothetical protein
VILEITESVLIRDDDTVVATLSARSLGASRSTTGTDTARWATCGASR